MDEITRAKLQDLHLLERQLETMAAQIAALRKQKDQLRAALRDMLEEYAKNKYNDLPCDKAARAALKGELE